MQSTITMSPTTRYYIELEEKHGAHNYHPLPVVLTRGQGVHVWDVEGKRYYDFLSGYSAVNQRSLNPFSNKRKNSPLPVGLFTATCWVSTKNISLVCLAMTKFCQ